MWHNGKYYTSLELQVNTPIGLGLRMHQASLINTTFIPQEHTDMLSTSDQTKATCAMLEDKDEPIITLGQEEEG